MCPERHGASLALAQLSRAGISIHVNSATPIIPLRSLVLRRYGAGTFAGVHGGHGAKFANLVEILRREQLHPSPLAMVGDGIDDRDAATNSGCQFVGIGGGSLAKSDPSGPWLYTLEHLWPLLCGDLVKEMKECQT